MSSGKSPVMGQSFAKLDPDYADKYKGGNRTPNLELEGDMLDSLTFEVRGDEVEVGIFSDKEAPKADGHNNFSGESKLPTRRFIPDSSEEFIPKISSGVEQILNRYKEEPTEPEDPFAIGSELALARATIEADTTIDDILKPFIEGGLFGER